MSDQFLLSGGYSTTPLGSPLSFAAGVSAVIQEPLTIKAKHVSEIDLSVNTPVAVDFGTLAGAHVVLLKAVGGKVKARVTSTDGATQAIPFDTYFILMSDSVPLTAIDLTRLTDVPTTVRVFLGEKA